MSTRPVDGCEEWGSVSRPAKKRRPDSGCLGGPVQCHQQPSRRQPADNMLCFGDAKARRVIERKRLDHRSPPENPNELAPSSLPAVRRAQAGDPRCGVRGVLRPGLCVDDDRNHRRPRRPVEGGSLCSLQEQGRGLRRPADGGADSAGEGGRIVRCRQAAGSDHRGLPRQSLPDAGAADHAGDLPAAGDGKPARRSRSDPALVSPGGGVALVAGSGLPGRVRRARHHAPQRDDRERPAGQFAPGLLDLPLPAVRRTRSRVAGAGAPGTQADAAGTAGAEGGCCGATASEPPRLMGMGQ